MRTHLVFGLDDTLTRTSYYFRNSLIDYFLETRDYDSLEILARYQTDNIFEAPPRFVALIKNNFIKRELYMLESKPTRLYSYYFLIPGNLNSRTKVSLCSFRGITPNGMRNSKLWLEAFKPNIDIQDIHILDPNKTPSKIDFLSNVYGDEFLLIDDNPYYDTSTIHEKDHRVAVYEECAKYNCHEKQNKIVFDGNAYRVNGRVIR